MKSNIMSNNCLRVVYRYMSTFLLRRIEIGPDKYDADGSLYNTFKTFASHYNICYTLTYHEFSFPPGELNLKNKTYDGSLGYLQRNEQDLFLSPLRGTPELYSYFDFSIYLSVVRHGSLIGYPKSKPNYAGFMQIFDSVNWIAVGCSLLVGFLFNVILNKTTKNLNQQYNPEPGIEKRSKTFGDSFLTTYGIFIGQGVINQSPKRYSIGLFFIVWLLASLILNFIYKSMLLSVMVVPKVGLPFTNIYEMLEQDEVKWKMNSHSPLTDEAKISPPDSTFGKLYARSSGSIYSRSDSKIYEEVLTGKWTVFFPDKIIPQLINVKVNQKDSCSYTKMKETFWSLPYFYMFSKGLNSTIKTYLNNVITRLTESGIFDHLDKKGVRPSVFYCISTAGIPRSSLRILELEDFFGMFGLLLIGYLAATVIFALEYVTWKLKIKKSQERS